MDALLALRILVVDDDAATRSAATALFEQLDLRLSEHDDRKVHPQIDYARTSEEALGKLAARAPDLVLLGDPLVGASCLDVLTQVSVAAPDALTLIMTERLALESVVAASKRGAYDFLAKPLQLEPFRATIGDAFRQLVRRRQARRQAEEKRRIRFEFVSVLAHELKAPLAAVEGYLLAMQDQTLGLNVQSYQPMIERSIVRLTAMREMVVDLLDLARLESAQRKREFERLDVVEVARSVIETVRGEAEARKVTLLVHADGPVPMVADRAEIELVISNLLTNAIKYNRDGGRVDLRVLARGSLVDLEVSDTGIGMTAEEAGRLFKEFSRIRNEKTRLIPGSGLGLSMVRKVALLYGGDAQVTSQPDAGTTVKVSFKAAPPTAPSSAEAPVGV
jgi:signal transduction histidine kinase